MRIKRRYLAVLMAILMCFVVLFNLQQTIEPLDLGGDVIDLGGKWEEHTYMEGDEVRYEYMTTIPDSIQGKQYFSFRIYYSSIDVLVDEEVIYSYKDLENRQGSCQQWIELPINSAGKILCLRSSNEEAYLKSTVDGECCIGELSAVFLRFLADNFLVLCVSLILLFLSLALFVAIIKFRMMRSHSNIRALTYLCIFLFVSGAWIVSDSQLLRLVSGRTAAVEAFSYAMFMQMPFWVFCLLNEIMVERRKSFDFMCNLLSICVSVILLLHILGIVRLGRSLVVYHALVLVSVVIVIVGVEKETKIHRGTSLRQIRVGIMLLLALSVGAIVMYYINAAFEYSILYALGLAIFSFSMLFGVLDNLQAQVKKSVQTDVYYELAYKDALTGMENRAALEEEQIRHGEVDSLAYIMIDLNDLKKINDILGHLEGDRQIKLAAECISIVFGPVGKCYRIGGDEFLICVENETAQKLDRKLFELEKLAKLKSGEPSLSLACGYAFRRKGETLRELFERADRAMYEQKLRMKKKRFQGVQRQ